MTCESTYALILCCVAKCVAELEVKSSSSLIAEPLTPVFNTALVNVLFVSVSVVARPTNVSVAFGKVIVLSAVGSVTVNVVSKSSAVEPSKTKLYAPIVRFAPKLIVPVLIVGLVNVLFVSV